jgi:ketol-acid reductoisomerase
MSRQSSGKKSAVSRKSAQQKPVIVILGYGGQGRALALNWRDAGYSVLVALRSRSKSAAKVRQEGLPVVSFEEAAVLGEVIVFAIPDHTHAEIFTRYFENKIDEDALLLFLHGTSITFNAVNPKPSQPIGLLAPHAPGVAVRTSFLSSHSLSGFVGGNNAAAIRQIRQLASAMGIPRSHQMLTTFRDESIGDLFGEQMVLCGGLAALISTGFKTLRTNGIKPKQAWLEVGYQIDLIVNLIKEYGIRGMFERISFAARHGSTEVAPVIAKALQPIMKKRFAEIANGIYANRLLKSNHLSNASLASRTKNISSDSLEKAAKSIARINKLHKVVAHGQSFTQRESRKKGRP